MKERSRALEQTWAQSIGNHCERDALPTKLYRRDGKRTTTMRKSLHRAKRLSPPVCVSVQESEVGGTQCT